MKYKKITKTECQEEALKYVSRKEFQKNCHLYQFAYRKKWLDEICSHMKVLKNGKITLEKCKETASQCTTRIEFYKKYCSEYGAALKNGWMNEICSHMIELIKPNGYWTYEKCKEAALMYNTKGEFRKNCSSAYNIIYSNNWCHLLSHMIVIGNRYNKCIYAYEFPDNHVYVGLTYNMNKRCYEHISNKNSSVYKYIQKTHLIPKIIKLTENLPVEEAIEKEDYYVKIYKENNWEILNRVKTGAIGSRLEILTKEYCKVLAKTCKSRTDFSNKYNGAYRKSLKNEWISDFFPNKQNKQK